jgi:hypothetical protein
MTFVNDHLKLSNLYEQVLFRDFLIIEESEVNSYNWDLFFEHKYLGILSRVVLESFNPVYVDKQTDEGTEDLYSITLPNGKIFQLVIDYTNPRKTKDIFSSRIISLQHKENTRIIGDLYEKYFSDLLSNEEVALIQFKDSSGRHNLTGDVGINSFQLFSSLKEGILDSFWRHNRISNLRGFIIRIDNREIRLLKLYQKLISKFLNVQFPHMFVDDITEKDVGMTLLVVTK